MKTDSKTIDMDDPYKYTWREETTEWNTPWFTPNHIYITKGRELYGYVPYGTTDVQMFKVPKRQWSASRRKFRNLGKKEITALCTNTDVK